MKNKKRSVFHGGIGILVFGVVQSAISQTPPVAPTNPNTFSGFPAPIYNSALSGQASTTFNKCFQQDSLSKFTGLTQDLLKKWGIKADEKDLSKTTLGKLQKQCTGEPSYASYDRKEYSCEDFKSGGAFDLGLLESKLASTVKDAKAGKAYQECEGFKHEGIREQLECVQLQSKALNDTMNSVLGEYQRNLQKAQASVQEAKKVQTQRQSEACDAYRILGGSEIPKPCQEMGIIGGPGDASILSLKSAALYGDSKDGKSSGGVISQMKTSFDAAQKQQRLMDTRWKIFKEKEKALPMALAKQCFLNQSIEGYACSESEQSVSAARHLMCRFQQNAQVGKGGAVKNDRFSASKAEKDRKALQTLIERLLSQIPETPAFTAQPSSEKNPLGEAAVNFSRPAGAIFSPQDLDLKYGAQLAQFNQYGTDVRGFINASFAFCYNQATKQIIQERGSNLSMIEQERQVIQEQDQALRQANGQMISQFAQFYSEGIRGLTGLDVPIDPKACEQGSPELQSKCMDQMRTNLDDLVYGRTLQSEIKILLKGGEANEEIKCRGLNGCAQTLSNFTKNVAVEINRIEQQKQQMTQKMNSEADQFTQKMAEAMTQQAQLVREGVSQMNKALVEMGASPLDIKDMASETMKPDETGLYRIPSSAAAVINGKLNPKLPDLQGDAMNKSLRSLAEVTENTKAKAGQFTKIEAAQSRLESLKESCTQDEAHRQLDPLREQIEFLFTNRCNYIQQFCEKNGADSLGNLESTMGEISQYLGGEVSEGNSSSLSGYSCPTDASQFEESVCVDPITKVLETVPGISLMKTNGEVDFMSIQSALSAAQASGVANAAAVSDELKGLRSKYEGCMAKIQGKVATCEKVYNAVKTGKGKIQTVGKKLKLGEKPESDDAE